MITQNVWRGHGRYRDTPTRLVLVASPAMPLYVSDDLSTLR